MALRNAQKSSLNRNDSGYMLTAPRITFKIFQDPNIKYF